MKIRKAHIIIICILLLFPIVGLCFYPLMPDKVAFHWSRGSEPDNYVGKFAGTFLMPVIFLVVFPLIALPGYVISSVYKSDKFRA